MSTRTINLPKKYHDAVVKWRQQYLPDYDFLLDSWEKYFPKEPKFDLCAYREMGMCSEIECGENKGKPKYTRASEMPPEQAKRLLGAIRAQASTEFGSIQQHHLTLARAQEEEEQVWVLRMMAEELRHGYQMLHVITSDDWSDVTDESGTEMIEEILSMTTGSHVLGAFNIDFDSFVDNILFCALIDRVGKYQLSMQKVSAYKPMAESMPQMLREEAFHLAAGVVPMRRWATRAAKGEVYVTMEMMQKALNKWVPRALEMFGDERGGGSNVRYGFKPMKNAEAQSQYYDEVTRLTRDVNKRFVRARVPSLGLAEADKVVDRVLDGETVEGITHEDLLVMPHPEFFRRRGVPAFRMIGVDGHEFSDVEDYIRHLRDHLPESYLAGRDFRGYVEALRKVASGELETKEAQRSMPSLRRVGGACMCSKGVRWVVDQPAPQPSANEASETAASSA